MLPPNTTENATTQYVREVMAVNARRRAELDTASGNDTLTSIIDRWWHALPVVTRNRRFAMKEISDAVYAQTRHRHSWQNLAIALEALNWTTGRDWTRAGRNRRYWKPPQSL